jgi:anti-sigma regulatory factor (Ser/Thr protein kinase)
MDRTHEEQHACQAGADLSESGHGPHEVTPPVELHFNAPARTGSVARVRATVGACAEIPRACADDVELVVSELFTNAILHSGLTPGDSIDVSVGVEDEVVTIEVRDRGPGIDPATVARHTEPSTTGGYGLRIVNALSQAWGCAPGGRVWAQLAPIAPNLPEIRSAQVP